MGLHQSGEMYLETIYVLSQKLDAVRSLDVAEHMNFSKPSVSRAVKLLKNADYINVDKDGLITLTLAGREVARKMYERHTILTKLLLSLGVDEETATEDACKIEHDLSDASFEAIKNYFSKQLVFTPK